MTDVIKLIHPKIGTVREIAVTNENKFRILKRAGFILFKDYKPPKPKEDVPEPTLAEIVAKEGVKVEVAGKKVAAEVAVHEEVKLPSAPSDEILVSKAADTLIKNLDLDLALIVGTGKDGKITVTDVDKHIKELEDAGLGNAQEAEDEELDDNIEIQVLLEDDGDLDSQDEVENDGSGEDVAPEGD